MTEQEWLDSNDPEQMLRSGHDGVSQRKLRLFAVACCRRHWGEMRDERSREAVRVAELYADGGVTDQQLADAAGPAEDLMHSIEARLRPVLAGESDSIEWQFDAGFSAACLAYAAASPADEEFFWIEMIDLVRASVRLCLALDNSGRDIRELGAEEDRRLAALLREVIGNPFSPPSLPAPIHVGCEDCQGKGWVRQAGQYLPDPCRPCGGRGYLPRPSGWLAWNDETVRRLAQGIYDHSSFDRLPILADALLDAGCDKEELVAHCRSEGPHVRGCWAVDVLTGKS